MSRDIHISVEALALPSLRNSVGENPVWDELRACWWWIDIPTGGIHCWQPGGDQLHHWQLDEPIGSMVLRPDGRLVCAGASGLFDVDVQPGQPARAQLLAAARHASPGMRFNDGRCDRQGRLWVSSMVSDISLAAAAGRWWRYTPAQGLVDAGHDGLIIPNGSAFSPDGRTRYSSDTHRDRRQVWRQAYDPDTGDAGEPEPFIDLRDPLGIAGRPDGATVDADGCYWICCLDEGAIRRYTPQGKLDLRLVLPMAKPTNCAFGGADRKTLFVTSLSRGADDLQGDPHGGRVLLCRPGFQGLPEPQLAG